MSTEKKKKQPDMLVWVDLEMTGLDVEKCVIIEAAMIITDFHFNEIACAEVVIWQPQIILDEMVPYVHEMHIKNDLLKKVKASKVSLEEAYQKLMAKLTKHVEYKQGMLTGNSVYMDRAFLKKYMPAFHDYLHYRQVDVSSIKVLSEYWYGHHGKAPKNPSKHTALSDIKGSIAELKFYKENAFRAM